MAKYVVIEGYYGDAQFVPIERFDTIRFEQMLRHYQQAAIKEEILSDPLRERDYMSIALYDDESYEEIHDARRVRAVFEGVAKRLGKLSMSLLR